MWPFAESIPGADLFSLSSPLSIHHLPSWNTSFLEETSSSSRDAHAMSLESAADLIRSWNREICDPWIGLGEKRFIDSLKGQNEIFHRLVALHQVSSSNFHPSSPLFDFPSIHPRGCISAYVDAVNNARVNGKSSVNVLSVETIPGNVPAGGIVWIAKDGIDSTRYTIRFNSSLSLFLSLSWWRALRDDLLAVTLCICIYIYVF